MNNRRQILMVILALAAGMLGGVVGGRFLSTAEVFARKGWHGGETIEAEKIFAKEFYLCDEKRAVKGTFTVTPEGTPALMLWRDGTKLGAELVLAEGGLPSLVLYDVEERPRAALGTIQLKEKRTGDVLSRTASSLVFFDETGKAIWSAP